MLDEFFDALYKWLCDPTTQVPEIVAQELSL